MRRRTTLVLFVALTALFLSAACGRTEDRDANVSRQASTKASEQPVAYEGPDKPGDSEWVLRSLNGHDAAEGSDITLLFPVEGELGVEGGCIGFALYHELEGDELRVVEPALQVGRLDCDKPEEVQQQAEGVLDIVRELERLEITRDRLELRSASDEIAVFVHPPPAQVDPTLVGTEWFLTLLGDEKPLPGPRLTLEIGREDIGGFSGCNEFGGAIDKMDEGTLTWSKGPNDGFASTMVGCAGPDLRQETAYHKVVASAKAYHLVGDRLELKNSEGQTVLVFSKKTQWLSDPTDLAGTRWVLLSKDGEKPPEGSVPTVEFESEKKVRWYDGCQNFSGTYIATQNDLAVPSYGVVGGDCMKPEAVGGQDGSCVVACFGPEGDYRLRDGLLEIRSETGETTSILEPLAEGEEPDQEGTPWALRGFVEGGRTTPVSADAGITLTFDRGTLRDEGTMFGSAGCNDYRVAYEHPIARNGPDRLVLADPAVTRRKCAGSPEIIEREQRFLGILRDVSYYPAIFASGRMTLDTEDDRKLIFSAPD